MEVRAEDLSRFSAEEINILRIPFERMEQFRQRPLKHRIGKEMDDTEIVCFMNLAEEVDKYNKVECDRVNAESYPILYYRIKNDKDDYFIRASIAPKEFKPFAEAYLNYEVYRYVAAFRMTSGNTYAENCFDTAYHAWRSVQTKFIHYKCERCDESEIPSDVEVIECHELPKL